MKKKHEVFFEYFQLHPRLDSLSVYADYMKYMGSGTSLSGLPLWYAKNSSFTFIKTPTRFVQYFLPTTSRYIHTNVKRSKNRILKTMSVGWQGKERSEKFVKCISMPCSGAPNIGGSYSQISVFFPFASPLEQEKRIKYWKVSAKVSHKVG